MNEDTPTRRNLIAALTLACVFALGALLWRFVGAGEVTFDISGERYELLSPRMLMFFSVAPIFYWIGTRSLADLPPLQKWLGVTLRVVLCASLCLALARLARTTDTTKVSTVYLVDVSDSVTDEAVVDARGLVAAAYENREDNDVQLITFASDARVIPLSGDTVPETILRHGRASDGARGGEGSDMQAALRLAYGIFPPGHLRRVVIVSDGGQTEGDLLAEASRAERFGVKVHYHLHEHGAPREVAIRELSLPDRIRVGEPFHVRARVFSSTATRARLRLYQGETLNGLDSVRDVELPAGESEVEFRSITRVAGPVTYRATLAPEEEDRFAANNRFETTVVVPGRPSVLYVEGARGRGSYLARALTAADYEVDVRGPRAVPTSARELERFDFFILSDVAANQVSMSQMDAIERYVRDHGGGFMMAGGERGFGLGGWQGTRMERLLPVRMDSERRRDQPSLGLALVIDRSGSMNGQKIELAKEAAKATAGMLSSDDYIEVIGFDSRAERVVRMQSARNRMGIIRNISRLTPRGGTAIFPALDAAYQDLAVTRARIKHVILLTDGQAPERGITELVQVMRAESITVSTVGLGADVNRALLQTIATQGGGRSYFTNDPHNVPRIFMRETSQVSRSSAVEEYFQPTVVQRADFLRGVNIQGSPYLHGYVATRRKPSPAQVILQSDIGEPILARWRVGLGWSLAWTSDVKNRWAVDWVRWPGFSRFWAQLVREHMRQRRRQRLDMNAEVVDGEVRVVVDAIGGDDHFMNDLDGTVTIEGPMGARARRRPPSAAPAPEENANETETETEVAANEAAVNEEAPERQVRRREEHALRQTAPGRYEARFPIQGFGSYVISAVHKREGRAIAESSTQLANPYPREYLTLEPDDRILSRAATLTGGLSSPTVAQLFDADGETIRSHEELWPKLLMLALALFLLDLLFRRVRLFDRDFAS